MRYLVDSIEYESTIGEFLFKGEKWKLSAMGTRVFNYFLKHSGELITYQQLMDDVWMTVVSENAVMQILTHIRQTFKKINGQTEVIKTLRGQGFMLNVSCSLKATQEVSKPTSVKTIGLTVLGFTAMALIAFKWYPKQDTVQDILIPVAQASRLIFISNNDESPNQFDHNKAAQSLMSELLRLSADNDVVDTTRYPLAEDQQALAGHLWRLNPQLNLVTTRLSQEQERFKLEVEITQGDQAKQQQAFSGKSMHEVVLDGVAWVATVNASQSLDADLLNMLPKDNYLVETYMRGLAMAQTGDNAKAIEYFQLCLQENQGFHLARLSLAIAYRRHSQYDESIAQLEALKSVKVDVHLSLAVDSEFAAVELLRGKLAEAKNMYLEVIATYPMSHRLYPAYMNLAATLYRMGEYDEALMRLQSLTQVMNEKTHPQDTAIIYFTISGVYLYQKQMEKSHEYLNKSLGLFEQLNDIQRQGMIHSRISNYHMMMGELDSANTHIQQSLVIARQLNNSRSELGALNELIKMKIIEGKFSEANAINDEMSSIATEINLLTGKIRAAQWNAVLALERKQLTQAKQHIDQHQVLAEESASEPSINSNLILRLRLAIEEKEFGQAQALIIQLEEMSEKDFLRQSYIPHHANYLEKSNQTQQAINYLLKQKEYALSQQDDILVQQLSVLLAKQYLYDAPNTALKMLMDIEVDDLSKHPYYSTLAEALFETGAYMEALVAMEKARKNYHERWNQDLQQLYIKIKKAATNPKQN